MTKSLEDEINRIVAKMDDQQDQDNSQQTSPDEVQDIYVLIVREHEDFEEDQANIVESAPATATFDVAPVTPQLQKTSFLPAYAICSFYLFLIVSCIAFQIYEILNPPIATVTIIPKSQTVTHTGTLQLGRVLSPLTISQSQQTPTIGKGHQDAKSATGSVTFYNGLFTQQFVASGTVYTGNDGVEIVTSEDATIPPGNPGSGYGTLTVTAQALQAGSKGNIQTGDVSITINNGLLVRNNEFHNGQDERNFQTVSKNDIDRAASLLKATLAQSMTGALEGQLKPSEQLSLLPCSPTVTPNRNVGDEATTLKVIVSLTCSAVAYNAKELENKATALLTTKAQSKFSGYSLFGDIQIKVNQASVSRTNTTTVFLSISATGKWIYGLSRQSQEHIKNLITGKATDQALKLLETMLGVERGSISFQGFTDDTKLPKNSSYIHIILIVM